MRYDVPLIPQTSGTSCWAACIAMLLGWKHRGSFDPLRVAENPGGRNYLAEYAGRGLPPGDTDILARNGLVSVRLTPDAAGLKDLLGRHGPMMVAGLRSGAAHWRVVAGAEVGKDVYLGAVHLNDPLPVGDGARYSLQARYFFEAVAGLARREAGEPAPVYFVRFR